jgi:hypothetical protein
LFDAVREGEPCPAFTFEDGPLRMPVFFEAEEYEALPTPASQHDALRTKDEDLQILLRETPHVVPLLVSTGVGHCPNFTYPGGGGNVNPAYPKAGYRRR